MWSEQVDKSKATNCGVELFQTDCMNIYCHYSGEMKCLEGYRLPPGQLWVVDSPPPRKRVMCEGAAAARLLRERILQ